MKHRWNLNILINDYQIWCKSVTSVLHKKGCFITFFEKQNLCPWGQINDENVFKLTKLCIIAIGIRKVGFPIKKKNSHFQEYIY